MDILGRWPGEWEGADPGSMARDVGVLVQERAQCGLIRQLLREEQTKRNRLLEMDLNLKAVYVASVDNSQGLEFRVILIGITYSHYKNETVDRLGFLGNKYLFNTAISRAKSKVVVIAHPRMILNPTLPVVECWRYYLQKCAETKGISFPTYLRSKQRGGVERIPSNSQATSDGVIAPFLELIRSTSKDKGGRFGGFPEELLTVLFPEPRPLVSVLSDEASPFVPKLPSNQPFLQQQHRQSQQQQQHQQQQQQQQQQLEIHVAGLRPETRNADPKPHKTKRATARQAVAA